MDERVDLIIERLGQPFEQLEGWEKALFTREIVKQIEAGWTDEDIVSYQRAAEEISPGLDEDVALARMDRISARYKEDNL